MGGGVWGMHACVACAPLWHEEKLELEEVTMY